MISKELLSEVLNRKDNFSVKLQKSNSYSDDRYCLIDELAHVECINIYELAHKCKEWASAKHKLSVQSAKGYNGWYVIVTSWNDSTFSTKSFSNIKTEPQAIYKACEWIFNNKD